MRYFLIAGEASGDLHAAQLIRALRARDPQAEFEGFGGDLMAAEGLRLHRHYRTLAFMGFVQVAVHLPEVLRALKECRAALKAWRPDVLICVDYAGFNLRIARWVRQQQLCPVHYFILPKIWAWNEGRIRALRRDVDRLFAILPFEPDYFRRRHGVEAIYVGNPTHDEVEEFLAADRSTPRTFAQAHDLPTDRPFVALLAGSRRGEISANLPRMLRALRLADPEGQFTPVLAAAPGIDPAVYAPCLNTPEGRGVHLVHRATYPLLHHAAAALVTSGTATLETALFATPQVVCYHMRGGRLINRLRPLFLNCRFISLVNLIADAEVVPELIAADTAPATIAAHLRPLLHDSPERDDQLRGYAILRHRLGNTGTPKRTAESIVQSLRHQAIKH